MSVLDSNIMKQATVDMFNMVRGREAPTSDTRRSDTPPRVKKMTLKNLAILRANKATFS